MKTYEDFTNKMNELSLYIDDLSRFDNYFEDIKDSKKTLKIFTKELNNLKILFEKTNLKEIKFDNSRYNDNENYELRFNRNINSHILALKDLYYTIEEKNILLFNKINKINNNEKIIFDFDVQIDRNNYNKFHFPFDLPLFLKNINLGKNIVGASLNEFKYCLFTFIDDSFELKMTIRSISENDDFYTFGKYKNILIFSKEQTFSDIENVLKRWFNEKINTSEYMLDKNFKDDYDKEIKNSFLNKLYQKYIY